MEPSTASQSISSNVNYGPNELGQELYDDFVDAYNSDFGKMFPTPTLGFWDHAGQFFNQNKGIREAVKEYVANVNKLRYQTSYDNSGIDRLIAAYKRNGINPYALLSGSGSLNGATSIDLMNSGTPAAGHNGNSALGQVIGFTIGALISAITRSSKAGKASGEVTRNVTNYFFNKK